MAAAILGIRSGVPLLRDADGSLPLYDESLTIYEDKLWVLEAGARISSALIMPHILYHYMFLPGSLTHKDTDIIDRQPLAYKAYDKILDFWKRIFRKPISEPTTSNFDVIFDDIHVLKDARHRDHYQKQYTETMATYKRLCKRIAPRTLYYPVRSPQFCSSAEGTHPSLSLPPTKPQPGIDITGKFGNGAADCHIPKRLEDQRIQEHDKSRKSVFFDALHR